MHRAAEVLDVLARKLPDGVLDDYFKDLTPDQVRGLLAQAANTLGPVKKNKPLPPEQKSLWKGAEKSWSGKLAGQTLLLYSDGASRGNPGEAGAGISICDVQGAELVGACLYLGQCTNNEAEYRALLFGLDECRKFGQGSLKIHLDSELIVKQINGQYKVKHPNLKPFFQDVMQKLAGFASFSVTHVRRELNRRADQLANQAIDNK